MKLRLLFFVVTLLVNTLSFSQEISGSELLEKAISFHDPNGNWLSLQAKLDISMTTPDNQVRNSIVEINLSQEYFQVTVFKDSITLKQTIDKGQCQLSLNGNSNISEEEASKHRLTCERAKMYKDYYTYLYGLPMKLKDQGTIIDSTIQKKRFKNKEYLVLKASYEKEIGEDTWYFYFDPTTFAMEVYQFFHDETKNDGEYILLTDVEEIDGIKIPKNRAWYYNKDDKYLGTDVLNNVGALQK